MSNLIAVTGKGGSGKTTVAALIVRKLILDGCTPVLALDADPNTCLDTALGVSVNSTVGAVREDTKRLAQKGVGAGISKQQLLELKISESLVEADDFDLLAMGRPEGPGCYCYANNVVKQILTNVAAQYPFIVLDNEAGLENLSRRIARKIDLLIMVCDPSRNGLKTIGRLHSLATEMGITYKQAAVVINRLRSSSLPRSSDELRQTINTDLIFALPEDMQLAAASEDEGSLFSLPDNNPVFRRVAEIIEQASGERIQES